MTKYKCLECGGDLVQMLESEPWDGRTPLFQHEGNIHYGFYCKVCQIMYLEKRYIVKDGAQSLEKVKSDE